MTFAAVIYEVVDGVAWVTLNRPQVLNAYSVQMRARHRLPPRQRT